MGALIVVFEAEISWFSIFSAGLRVEFEIFRVPRVSAVIVFRVIVELFILIVFVFVILFAVRVFFLVSLPRVISPALIFEILRGFHLHLYFCYL